MAKPIRGGGGLMAGPLKQSLFCGFLYPMPICLYTLWALFFNTLMWLKLISSDPTDEGPGKNHTRNKRRNIKIKQEL